MLMNLIPFDGELYYYPNFLNLTEADYYFDAFLNRINWEHDELMMFGKKITTKREVAWYAEQEITYKYSGSIKKAKLFNEDLLKLRNKISDFSDEIFNACLLNLYHTGEEGMGWHSDDEPEIEKNSCIASISLGASRYFDFKHKLTGEKVRILLEHGSLLLMKSVIQSHWLHSIPISKKVKSNRISLTFRKNIIP